MARPLLVAAFALLALVPSRPALAAAAVERRIDGDGVERSYLIEVPTSWDRRQPIPVLFVFHGAGSSARAMADGVGFGALAETTNALVVYPEAHGRGKRFDVDPPAGRESEDVRFFDALLERLRGRFPVDDRRICATGFSNGAAFCYRLAAERPSVVAAIAPVAGYLPSLTRAGPVEPVPLLHVHGTADRRVSPPPLFGDEAAPVPTWARWNGCTKGPETSTLAGTGTFVVRRAAYSGPSLRCDAMLLLVEGEDHAWAGAPGGPITQAVFDFLLGHPRDTAKAPAAPTR